MFNGSLNSEPQEQQGDEQREEFEERKEITRVTIYPITTETKNNQHFFEIDKLGIELALKKAISNIIDIFEVSLKNENSFKKQLLARIKNKKNEITRDLLMDVANFIVISFHNNNQDEDEKKKEPKKQLIEAIINYCKLKKEGIILFKIYYQAKDYELRVSHGQILLRNFQEKLESIEKVKDRMQDNSRLKKLLKVADTLKELKGNDEKKFIKCLIKGRFDKSFTKLDKSLIMGNNGGVFLLLNSLNSEDDYKLIIEDGKVPENFLKSKIEVGENQMRKVVIGKGSFGTVRFALCVVENENVGFGEIICVKKVRPEGTSNLKKISDETLLEYMQPMLPKEINPPKLLDMALVLKEIKDKNIKGYIFMELLPHENAEILFNSKGKSEFLTWEEYQKPFILGVLNSMSILLKKNLFFSDLKLNNTLFDTAKKRTHIVDTGATFEFDIKSSSLPDSIQMTPKFCAPELLEYKNNSEGKTNKIDLFKCMSYSCGIIINTIIQRNTDLNDINKEKVFQVALKLINERMELEKAIEEIASIGIKYNDQEILSGHSECEDIKTVRFDKNCENADNKNDEFVKYDEPERENLLPKRKTDANFGATIEMNPSIRGEGRDDIGVFLEVFNDFDNFKKNINFETHNWLHLIDKFLHPPNPDKLIARINNLDLAKYKISESQNGSIYKVNDGASKYSVKLIKCRNHFDLFHALREINVLSKAYHINQVVKINWVLSKIDEERDGYTEIYIGMDYIKKSLRDILNDPKIALQLIQKLDILRNLLIGLVEFERYSENLSLIHGDIKPENVLVDIRYDEGNAFFDKNRVYFTGFGQGKFYPKNQLLHENLVSVKSDIFAMGVVASELFNDDIALFDLQKQVKSQNHYDNTLGATKTLAGKNIYCLSELQNLITSMKEEVHLKQQSASDALKKINSIRKIVKGK